MESANVPSPRRTAILISGSIGAVMALLSILAAWGGNPLSGIASQLLEKFGTSGGALALGSLIAGILAEQFRVGLNHDSAHRLQVLKSELDKQVNLAIASRRESHERLMLRQGVYAKAAEKLMEMKLSALTELSNTLCEAGNRMATLVAIAHPATSVKNIPEFQAKLVAAAELASEACSKLVFAENGATAILPRELLESATNYLQVCRTIVLKVSQPAAISEQSAPREFARLLGKAHEDFSNQMRATVASMPSTVVADVFQEWGAESK